MFGREFRELRGYELALLAVDDEGRELPVVDVWIEDGRKDFVFSEVAALTAADAGGGRVTASLICGSVSPAGEAYLGTFVFKVPYEARGAIKFSVEPGAGTFLLDEFGRAMDVKFHAGPSLSVR